MGLVIFIAQCSFRGSQGIQTPYSVPQHQIWSNYWIISEDTSVFCHLNKDKYSMDDIWGQCGAVSDMHDIFFDEIV